MKRNRRAFLTFLTVCLLTPFSTHAALIERPNEAGAKPLSFGLATQADAIVVSPNDRFLVVNDQKKIVLVDTADWNLADPQPEALEERTQGFAFLTNTQSVFALQTDNVITRILADNPLTDVLTVDLEDSIGSGGGSVISDPELGDPHLYFFIPSNNTLVEYSTADRTVSGSVTVTNEDVTAINDVAYVALPAEGNQGGDVDELIVATSNSRVVFYDEDLNVLSTLVLSGVHEDCNPNANLTSNVLPAVAVSPDRTLAFVLNSSDNVVHVVDTITQEEVDTDGAQNGVNPICLHQVGPNGIDQDVNVNIRDVVVTRIFDPANAPRALVAGALGVTVLNATRTELGIVDAADGMGQDAALLEPIPMAVAPRRITASSSADGYVYTTNVDNSVSVISEKPYLTIASANPATVNDSNPKFTVTFKSDEPCAACTYRLVLNGEIDQTGGTTLLEAPFGDAAANQNFDTAAVDITAFPAGTFIEGKNRVFVFASNEAGLVGRDSVFVTVDRPPPPVKIVKTAFGNTKIFLTFERLTEEDIARYDVYFLPSEDPEDPVCPGNLDFAAATPTSLNQPDSGGEITAEIRDLTNQTPYCLAVRVVDDAGSFSEFSYAGPVTPDITVGITGLSGEFGCSLVNSTAESKSSTVWIWAIPLLLFVGLRRVAILRRGVARCCGVVLILALAWTPRAQASEVTDQHWSAQFQGGFFLPHDAVVDFFLGDCCNAMYNFTFGRLWQDKYELNIGVGLLSEGAKTIGLTTAQESGESFNFTVVPISNSFVWRGDFFENQLFVPYFGAGLDYLFFRENLQGNVTKGFKFGYHAMAGGQILLEFFDSAADSMEEYGVNDVYLTLEAKWQQIDNFGGAGLAFTGWTYSAGLLFNF